MIPRSLPLCTSWDANSWTNAPLSIAEPGAPGVGSAYSRLKWRPKAGPWHPGNASNA